MMFKHLVVMLVIFVLVNPTECGWFKKLRRKVKKGLKKIGSGIRKGVKNLGKAVKKVGCKVLFGVGCPALVGAAGAAIGAGTSGTGAAIVAAGVVAGTHACHVRKNKCKRSVETGITMLAFSDDFRDYDTNGDKLIEYEEFVFAVMRSVDMAQPPELREPFNFTDENGDGMIDMDEFQGAPFLFAHATTHDFIKQPYVDAETIAPMGVQYNTSSSKPEVSSAA